MFWENAEQAAQRLTGSVVMFDKTHPVLFRGIDSDTRGAVTIVQTGSRKTLPLDDERWNNYRDLPSLGFVNTKDGLYLLQRRPGRHGIHGLSRTNTAVRYWEGSRWANNLGFGDLIQSYGKYYFDACNNDFPTFDQSAELAESNVSSAFHSKYAICCDTTGVRNLIRYETNIGIVLTNRAVLLHPKFTCYREELATLGVNQILEL